MIQQDSSASFDFHLTTNESCFNECKGDHVERAKQQIKMLQTQNQELQSQLKYIKTYPNEIIKSFKDKLMARILQLREQNEGIQILIQKSKIPGYAEMTKKKSNNIIYTNQNSVKKMEKEEEEEEQSSWNDLRKKNNIFDESQISQKCQISTCQNFNTNIELFNPLRTLEPLQNNQLQARAQITMELLQVIDRTSQISLQMEQISNLQTIQPQICIQHIEQNNKKIQQISKYKQKLLHLLKKLRIRESNQQQIVKQYKKMYEEVLMKLKQATQLLNLLGSTGNGDQNLDDLYAQVLQLQQKLKYINEQLEKLDQTQWLKDIQIELLQALKRLGISPPAELKNTSGQQSNQNLRQRIDILSQILIQCVLNYKADEKEKLALLKLYYEQEKQNNKKIIKNLQKKEQGLSKKLIDLQTNNN